MNDSSVDKAIKQNRMATITIRTRPNASVKVKQIRHEFWFGTCIARRTLLGTEHAEDMEKYRWVVKENFNSAVHENALKWPNTEPEKGKVSYKDADAILDWCEKNDIKMRGHCVFWEKQVCVQDWLKSLDDGELKKSLRNRAKDVLSRYKGRISEYDVNNEMLHGDFYVKRFGDSIHVDMFNWCKEADPNAKLYVNDYEIIDGEYFPRYVEHIEKLLEAGAPISGIGIQGHLFLGKVVDTARIKDILDKLSQFNLPIKITEFDVRTLDETVKAENLRNVYTACFAHSSVDGVFMWGFWQNSNWLSTNKVYGIKGYTSLWKKDWAPTPSVKVYRDLVFNEWWTDWRGEADAKGVCSLNAFYGKHLIEVCDKKQTIELKKEEGNKTITVD
ncbi:MAG: endo-1,4-beta-xylanase [Candidatus Ratteibacteria bacterium]|nr:endo-1,4-beta-xylanase [Candidatus Ratteibacteria bacterium]